MRKIREPEDLPVSDALLWTAKPREEESWVHSRVLQGSAFLPKLLKEMSDFR